MPSSNFTIKTTKHNLPHNINTKFPKNKITRNEYGVHLEGINLNKSDEWGCWYQLHLRRINTQDVTAKRLRSIKIQVRYLHDCLLGWSLQTWKSYAQKYTKSKHITPINQHATKRAQKLILATLQPGASKR